MLLAKSFLAFLVGILLSYCLTPLDGKNFMIAAPIICMLWSTKVLHANFPLICTIFSIMFMKPIVTWQERAPRVIWIHLWRIIPTNVNLLTERLLHLTIFRLLQKPPSIKYWRFQTYFIPITVRTNCPNRQHCPNKFEWTLCCRDRDVQSVFP